MSSRINCHFAMHSGSLMVENGSHLNIFRPSGPISHSSHLSHWIILAPRSHRAFRPERPGFSTCSSAGVRHMPAPVAFSTSAVFSLYTDIRRVLHYYIGFPCDGTMFLWLSFGALHG